MNKVLLACGAMLLALPLVLGGHTTVSADTVGTDHQAVQSWPVELGTSGGNIFDRSMLYCCSGTLGSLVEDGVGNLFILSNNHVLGTVGPDLCPNTATPGTWTLQPGTLDIGLDPGNDLSFIAGIFVASVPIEFSPFANNLVDAAISFTTEGLASTNILDIGSPNVGFEFPTPGMKVIKSGPDDGRDDRHSAVGQYNVSG